jgi:diaminopimelate epimerase
LPRDPAALSRAISDRHFGVGGDGLILICRSEKADARMRMYNADGSEAEMCATASAASASTSTTTASPASPS